MRTVIHMDLLYTGKYKIMADFRGSAFFCESSQPLIFSLAGMNSGDLSPQPDSRAPFRKPQDSAKRNCSSAPLPRFIATFLIDPLSSTSPFRTPLGRLRQWELIVQCNT